MLTFNCKELNTFQKEQWVTFIEKFRNGLVLDLSKDEDLFFCSAGYEELNHQSFERFFLALAKFSISTLNLSKNFIDDKKNQNYCQRH